MSKIMIFSNDSRIVLASGSPYRRALLERIGISPIVCPADIDESPQAGEHAAAVAARLAREKARAVASRFPEALIVGSDQVGSLDGSAVFGKPGNHAGAVAQLTHMSGKSVQFHTAACLLNSATGRERCASVPTHVRFRSLTQEVIESYLRKDTPYDCAGSAKIESLGIALVEWIRSDDPTALLGLPLIALLDMLAAEGVHAL